MTTYRVEHLYSHVNVMRQAADRYEAFVRVGRLARSGWGSRVGDTDLTLGLGSDFIDFLTAFADDYNVNCPTSKMTTNSLAPTRELGMKICCICVPG